MPWDDRKGNGRLFRLFFFSSCLQHSIQPQADKPNQGGRFMCFERGGEQGREGEQAGGGVHAIEVWYGYSISTVQGSGLRTVQSPLGDTAVLYPVPQLH